VTINVKNSKSRLRSSLSLEGDSSQKNIEHSNFKKKPMKKEREENYLSMFSIYLTPKALKDLKRNSASLNKNMDSYYYQKMKKQKRWVIEGNN